MRGGLFRGYKNPHAYGISPFPSHLSTRSAFHTYFRLLLTIVSFGIFFEFTFEFEFEFEIKIEIEIEIEFEFKL